MNSHIELHFLSSRSLLPLTRTRALFSIPLAAAPSRNKVSFEIMEGIPPPADSGASKKQIALRHVLAIAACLVLLCFLLAGCDTVAIGSQRFPALPNGCTVNATSYRYSWLAQQQLSQTGAPWAKVLMVWYSDNEMGHTYCVFTPEGDSGFVYAYDGWNGTFCTRTASRDAMDIARQIGKLKFSDTPVSRATFTW